MTKAVQSIWITMLIIRQLSLSTASILKADMQILNYGKATSIDQQQLKQAKSVAEASKGSMLENFIKGFSEKLGQSDVSEHPVAHIVMYKI